MSIASPFPPKATRWLALLVALVLPFVTVAHASDALPADEAFTVRAERLPDGMIRLDFTIAPATHLYRDKIKVTSDGKPVAVATPPGTIEDDPSFGPTEVYRGTARAAFTPPSSGDVKVAYQGCQDHGICYPPVTSTLNVSTLQFSGTKTSFAAPEISSWGNAAVAPAPATQSSIPAAAADTSLGIARSNWLLVLLSFAGFGLLLAFTPCVLPMYPILGGMLAREGESLSAGRGFVVSLAYVLAMAFAFGLLGVAAAWSGQNLQVALQSPLAIGIISAVFVMLALSMFGLFNLAMPAAIANRIARSTPGRRGSIVSAAILGFSSAPIVGPCVTPPLAAALVYVAQTGNVARGAAALFALGLGQGLPLIAFGTFGSGLLPKTGRWMEATKNIFGFVFLAAAVWMLSRIVGGAGTMMLWAALLVTAGVFVGAFDSLRPSDDRNLRFRKAGGLLAVVFGVLLAIGGATGGTNPLRPLASLSRVEQAAAPKTDTPEFSKVDDTSALDAALSSAGATGKPSFVYFTAQWCISCRAIDRDVLPDASVQRALAGYSRIEVDLTHSDPDKQAMMSKLGVAGPPTMLFFPSGGAGKPVHRLIGETSAVELVAAATSARSSQ